MAESLSNHKSWENNYTCIHITKNFLNTVAYCDIILILSNRFTANISSGIHILHTNVLPTTLHRLPLRPKLLITKTGSKSRHRRLHNFHERIFQFGGTIPQHRVHYSDVFVVVDVSQVKSVRGMPTYRKVTVSRLSRQVGAFFLFRVFN